jgi:hypothetical protein
METNILPNSGIADNFAGHSNRTGHGGRMAGHGKTLVESTIMLILMGILAGVVGGLAVGAATSPKTAASTSAH